MLNLLGVSQASPLQLGNHCRIDCVISSAGKLPDVDQTRHSEQGLGTRILIWQSE